MCDSRVPCGRMRREGQLEVKDKSIYKSGTLIPGIEVANGVGRIYRPQIYVCKCLV